MNARERCPDCHAWVPHVDGPHPHPYLGGTPGCWQIYGEVLAREYGDRAYWEVHRLTVDAYSAQHPGKPERRAIQSVNGHLFSLHLMLERRLDSTYATRALGALIDRAAAEFKWLEPPPDPGPITVVDVHVTRGVEEHVATVRRWAASVWGAWAAHHDAVRELARRHLG